MISLRPGRVRSGPFFLWLLVMALLGTQLVLRLPEERFLEALGLYAIAGIAMAAIGLALSRAGGRREGLLLRLYDKELRLPIGVEQTSKEGSPQVMTVPVRYRDITAIFSCPGKNGFVWLGSSSGTFVYPLRAFHRPQDALLLVESVRAEIEAEFDGPARLEKIDAISLPAAQAHSRRTPVSSTLILLLVAIFCLELWLGAADGLFGVARFGAVAPSFLKQAQWWRVILAPLLSDTSSMGLLFTAGGLMYVGRRLEQLLGGGRLIVIYALAGWVGVVVAALADASTLIVGTGAAAIGLLGAFAFLTQRRGEAMPLGFRFPFLWWATAVLLLGVLPATFLMGDVPAQIGGVIGGVIALALLVPDESPLPLGLPSSRLASAALACVCGLSLVAGVLGVRHALDPASADDDLSVLSVFLDRNLGTVEELNLVAWTAAIDKDASPARLKLAKRAAERAVDREEDGRPERLSMVEDTLATVEYRLGKIEPAALLQVKALARTPNLQLASQLARFLAARPGVLYAPNAPPLDQEIELRHHAARGFGLNISAAPPVDKASTVYGLIYSGEKLEGLLNFCLKPGQDHSHTQWLAREGTRPGWPEGSRIRPALVLPGCSAPWQGWGFDPDIEKLP